MFTNKKILLAITGSIAAYKATFLIRNLLKNGAEVKVVMTKAATSFITPLTVATLSKNNVLIDLFEKDTWANHVMLGRWADVMLIAPASCNTIAKLSNGLCDNLLAAVYLSATCPVIIAPAMDEDMWKHPSTINNLKKLEGYGNTIMPVNNGELASGLIGEGRMAEPEEIVNFLNDFFKTEKDLLHKKILITAGPTHEPLDPVRFIGNNSSGKMGIEIAKECVKRGATVNLIIGPTTEKIPDGINVLHVTTAETMLNKCLLLFDDTDIAIMSAAVADYTPVVMHNQKIKKTETIFSIDLKRTTDILSTLGAQKKSNQILVGFALETENEKVNALNKLKNKNADFIVLNSLNDDGAGFGHNTNKITIFDNEQREFNFETKSKMAVATDIINTILNK